MLKTFFAAFSALALGIIGLSLTFAARGHAPASVAAPKTTYLGFDRDIYPGDAALPILRKTFAFTSFWLSPPPEEKTTTWLGKRDLLRKHGFGFLVLYRGRDSREFKNAADGPDKGNSDAQAAAATAKKQGFPAGTIIFLDVEEGGRLPAVYHTYLHTWLDVLAKNGYRAGVYCSGMPAKEPGGVTVLTANDIRDNAGSREFIFFVYNDACPPSPGCTFPASAPTPSGSGINYAQAWQYAQSPRRKEFAANCPPGYHPNGNCYAPGDASSAWDLDADTATSADPSRP
ncbi:MAG: glycoside hydrolase domain-containing protein [Candidatus Acidiferrum sp.]